MSTTETAARTGGEVETEVQNRRTFAIISHPDAGKTTLTENLLLKGGAIRLAGQVKARGDNRPPWKAVLGKNAWKPLPGMFGPIEKTNAGTYGVYGGR